MSMIAGAFTTQFDAEQALLELKSAGFADDKLTLLTPVPQPVVLDAPRSPDGVEGATDAAALGAAVGVIAGGGLAGPVGAALGAVAGGGIGGYLASRGGTAADAAGDHRLIAEGRYLLTVDARSPSEEEAARNVLAHARALHVAADPDELRDHPGELQEIHTSALSAGLIPSAEPPSAPEP